MRGEGLAIRGVVLLGEQDWGDFVVICCNSRILDYIQLDGVDAKCMRSSDSDLSKSTIIFVYVFSSLMDLSFFGLYGLRLFCPFVHSALETLIPREQKTAQSVVSLNIGLGCV